MKKFHPPWADRTQNSRRSHLRHSTNPQLVKSTNPHISKQVSNRPSPVQRLIWRSENHQQTDIWVKRTPSRAILQKGKNLFGRALTQQWPFEWFVKVEQGGWSECGSHLSLLLKVRWEECSTDKWPRSGASPSASPVSAPVRPGHLSNRSSTSFLLQLYFLRGSKILNPKEI